jgi:hypothetical protein
MVNDVSMRGRATGKPRTALCPPLRPAIDVRVYTDDAETLRCAVTRNLKKEIGLDAVKQSPTQPQQFQARSLSMTT